MFFCEYFKMVLMSNKDCNVRIRRRRIIRRTKIRRTKRKWRKKKKKKKEENEMMKTKKKAVTTMKFPSFSFTLLDGNINTLNVH